MLVDDDGCVLSSAQLSSLVTHLIDLYIDGMHTTFYDTVNEICIVKIGR